MIYMDLNQNNVERILDIFDDSSHWEIAKACYIYELVNGKRKSLKEANILATKALDYYLKSTEPTFIDTYFIEEVENERNR